MRFPFKRRRKKIEIWIGPKPKRNLLSRIFRRKKTAGLIITLALMLVLTPYALQVSRKPTTTIVAPGGAPVCLPSNTDRIPAVKLVPKEARGEHVTCTITNWWGNWVGLGKLFVTLRHIFGTLSAINNVFNTYFSWVKSVYNRILNIYKRGTDFLHNPTAYLAALGRSSLLQHTSLGQVFATIRNRYAQVTGMLKDSPLVYTTKNEDQTAAIAKAGYQVTGNPAWGNTYQEVAHNVRRIAVEKGPQTALKAVTANTPTIPTGAELSSLRSKEELRKKLDRTNRALAVIFKGDPISPADMKDLLEHADDATLGHIIHEVNVANIQNDYLGKSVDLSLQNALAAHQILKNFGDPKAMQDYLKRVDKDYYFTQAIKDILKINYVRMILEARILDELTRLNTAVAITEGAKVNEKLHREVYTSLP
ncbi:hypothetical protein [Thermosulfurimonas sp. F29]|uniref:hypothetical protein n=1 Tax=Thermosulfurimonas sp. F29 TaxID=2867247 RepID=UPI001C82C29D|nr:hypothetical protein [Thermosulfurimonas sp. F29]MBX6424232.1 hypothetical protein [Thermosulfurimonas sp. F29]